MCSVNLQVILKDSAVCSSSFDISMGRTELRVFLLGHLDLELVSRKLKQTFHSSTQFFLKILYTNTRFLKRWEYQTTFPVSWETYIQVTRQQLELDMEKWTGSKLGKEYIKVVYCHPVYLTYMQSTSCEMLGLMKCKLESRLLGEI